MAILITILISLGTAALFLDSVLLVLLVLIQLPKKEAGAGLAFGGGATDTLFGAGSGNALTNITKYTIVIFFALSLGLGIAQNHVAHTGKNSISEALKKAAQAASPVQTPAPAVPPGTLNNLLLNSSSLTNGAKAASTNAARTTPAKSNSAAAAPASTNPAASPAPKAPPANK